MFKLWFYSYPGFGFGPLDGRRVIWEGEGEGGAGGGIGEAGEGSKGKEDDSIPKGEHDKLKQDFEDLRLEVLSPDYLDFLASREDGGQPEKDETIPKDDLTEDKIEKLSKKELLDLAEKRAEEKYSKKLGELESTSTQRERDATNREIQAFARGHEDYSVYRPLMHGLSRDPKNQSLTLLELYTKAKEHVQGIHTGTTEAEKEKQRKIAGEKPSGSSLSMENEQKYAKMSDADIAKEAFAEVKSKLGEITA